MRGGGWLKWNNYFQIKLNKRKQDRKKERGKEEEEKGKTNC